MKGGRVGKLLLWLFGEGGQLKGGTTVGRGANVIVGSWALKLLGELLEAGGR